MAMAQRVLVKAARLVWRVTRPRTIGVRALLLDAQERVLLVRHRYAPGWYLPGGGVQKGEGTAAALARELAEEVAIADAQVERVLGVYHSQREGKDDHVVIFVARIAAAGTAPARTDALEIAEAAWFALDALPDALSPATGRRIAEYRRGATGTGDW